MTKIFGDKIKLDTNEEVEDILRGHTSQQHVILRALKIIATHLSYLTGANLKEEDLDP